jgi:tetratricopeptide (TPR) repeat protein
MSATLPSSGLPEPDVGPPPSPLEAIAAELEGLRRKVDDNAALIRRNQLAMSELADSVGKLVAQQRRRERSFTLSSFVAYLLFTVLLGGGVLLLYQSRADDLVSARRRAEDDLSIVKAKIVDLEADMKARDDAAAIAHGYWQLLKEEDHHDKAIAQFREVEAAALTPTERELFAEREKQARAEIVNAGYLAGLDAFRAGKHGDAIPALRGALGYEEEGPRAAQMRYYLGVALVKTKAFDEGARQLELSLVGRIDDSGVVDARYWLAVALEKLERLDEARAEYDKFATAQPQHPLSVGARRKSAELARRATPRN